MLPLLSVKTYSFVYTLDKKKSGYKIDTITYVDFDRNGIEVFNYFQKKISPFYIFQSTQKIKKCKLITINLAF